MSDIPHNKLSFPRWAWATWLDTKGRTFLWAVLGGAVVALYQWWKGPEPGTDQDGPAVNFLDWAVPAGIVMVGYYLWLWIWEAPRVRCKQLQQDVDDLRQVVEALVQEREQAKAKGPKMAPMEPPEHKVSTIPPTLFIGGEEQS